MSTALICAFTGAYRDAVTGAYPLGNGYRSYLPSLMRFAAPDDLSPFDAGGPNPYAYCGADPINGIDPSGHAWIPGITSLEEGVTHELAGAEQSITHTASSSIAAENAADGIGSHSQQALSPAQWQKENNAATVIQRHWRGFSTKRKMIPDLMRQRLHTMGEPMTSADDYPAFMEEGRLLVQANGRPGNPVLGHSAFYIDEDKYHLHFPQCYIAWEPWASKFGMSEQVADYMNKLTKTDIYKAGRRSQILSDFAVKKPPSMDRLVGIGRIFVLDPKYSAHFRTAYEQEVASFHEAPYSYGIHYNCNTFVYNVLNRLSGLAK